uniref:TPR_REGION domain-containing protein n=1 Tax=Syphacia muris TaxID=451379 RepID=A0A158R4W9_9BILA
EYLDECIDFCDYPVYIRGKIAQIEGELDKALYWFSSPLYEKALEINPRNAVYLCRIGQINFLLGYHKKAAEYLQESIEMNSDLTNFQLISVPDIFTISNRFFQQAYYWRALALYYMKRNDESIKKAQECLASMRHIGQLPEVLIFMAKLLKKTKDYRNAARAYEQVVKLEPDNVDALTNLGLLYYQEGNDNKAFEMFGRALSYDSSNGDAIIAAGSIIQSNGDFDVALAKYRVAMERCDYNSALWNNIGMCFYGKGKYIAAISCLKKANYLSPLDWKISFNLGLLHYSMEQFASAYHFLSTSTNLNPHEAMPYAALAAVLTNLKDFENARKAYEKALSLDKKNPQILHNYAVFELHQQRPDKAEKLLRQCEEQITWNNPRKKVHTYQQC